MLITIDTSALLAVLVNEPYKANIIELTRESDLQAPASLDAEVGNALSAMIKRNRISASDAEEVIIQYEKIPIRRTQIRLAHAIELAATFNIYAYDAYVLDCAKQYQTPLLSLDKRMVEFAKRLQITTLEVTP
ncbi:MAG: type II toxin-antitoxin system VapC family toxin [Balneolaceae bacterium]